MLHIIGLSEIFATIIALSSTESAFEAFTDYVPLRKGFRLFLHKIQPTIPQTDVLFHNQYLYDTTLINKIIPHFSGTDFLTDMGATVQHTERKSMKEALAHIKHALSYIKNRQPDIFKLFNTVIHTLFYMRSRHEGGGSVSSAIGTIWCSNKKEWSLQDCTEFLLHELIHNVIFIDELRYRHYISLPRLGEEQNYCLSSILARPRPIDKVFHSLIVALEIVFARLEWLGEPVNPFVHPPTEQILKNIGNTIESLQSISHENLVTERFRFLLDIAAQKFVDAQSQFYRNLLHRSPAIRC